MKFYLVYTESSNYAGGGEWYVTQASDHIEAEIKISEVAEDYWMAQDQDQYLDENDNDDEGISYSSIQRVFELTAGSLLDEGEEDWVKFLSEKGLGNSVTCVGCEEAQVIEAAKQIKLELGI